MVSCLVKDLINCQGNPQFISNWYPNIPKEMNYKISYDYYYYSLNYNIEIISFRFDELLVERLVTRTISWMSSASNRNACEKTVWNSCLFNPLTPKDLIVNSPL